ncbi:MAG: pyridoxamine 5'-phosphate oxidase family protein [Clostridia bacterium]|nr:pyridoxamine 5'-phosphate oxidase family protein [Clostridia bacterium]
MNANIFEKANQIIASCDTAYIGVIDESGNPSVSTVSPIKPKNIFEAYFATGTDANKTKRLLKNNRASVCYCLDGANITLVGTAEVLTDQATKSQYWLDWFIDHFSGGKTDPSYCIIKFTTKRVSLWIDHEGAEFTIDSLLAIQSRCGLLCDGCAYKESHGCAGCIALNGHPFWGECPVAACCQAKGYAHCGECGELPCDTLREFSCGDSEHSDKPAGARISVCRAWAAKKP